MLRQRREVSLFTPGAALVNGPLTEFERWLRHHYDLYRVALASRPCAFHHLPRDGDGLLCESRPDKGGVVG